MSSRLAAFLQEHAWAHVNFRADAKERRKSGLVIFGGFALIGVIAASLPILSGNSMAWHRLWFFWALALVLGLGMMVPSVGIYVYRFMMGVSGLVAFLVNTLLLGLIFYGGFVLGSLILKISGKDLLDRRKHQDDTSWHVRERQPNKEQYHRLS